MKGFHASSRQKTFINLHLTFENTQQYLYIIELCVCVCTRVCKEPHTSYPRSGWLPRGGARKASQRRGHRKGLEGIKRIGVYWTDKGQGSQREGGAGAEAAGLWGLVKSHFSA